MRESGPQLPTTLGLRSHRRGDNHQDRGNGNRHEPAGPVNAGATVATERRVEVPADDDSSDTTQDGEPEWDVVPTIRSNKLAEQANNDARDNHSDDLHVSS